MASARPNILYIMTDQQRYDSIAALGNPHVYTPNFDRLVRRGVAFTNAYSSCPVCVPARYNIRTGCEPPRMAVFRNDSQDRLVEGQALEMEERCGPFLARRMGQLDYRTFGIGKFHSFHEDLGYETFLRAEEMWGTPERRSQDAYAGFIEREHPEFSFLEQLHGERTEMYYMPQLSPLPAELTYEGWAARVAAEQVESDDDRPFFGFVSLIGPHPPLAPPIPFNRMYDPDRMPNPVVGDLATDHMDEQIPWMNYLIWADDIGPARARACKARYWGEVSYIDQCLGRILDAVDARPDGDNTLICFFTDHGEMLGDHHAWQKECYFEQACHIPFLVSWPDRIQGDARNDDLVALTDLFGIATGAAGELETRDGIDVLGLIESQAKPREAYVAMYEVPGAPQFKLMVRAREWKYIYIANGGREQLFNLSEDPNEIANLAGEESRVTSELRRIAIKALNAENADRALDGHDLRAFPFQARPISRIYQMAGSRGVRGFPEKPEDVLR